MVMCTEFVSFFFHFSCIYDILLAFSIEMKLYIAPPIPDDTTELLQLRADTTYNVTCEDKLTMFWCLQAIIGGVVNRDFAEK